MYFYFSCKICEYDSDEAKGLSVISHAICPICFEDCGHANELSFREATKEEIQKFRKLP